MPFYAAGLPTPSKNWAVGHSGQSTGRKAVVFIQENKLRTVDRVYLDRCVIVDFGSFFFFVQADWLGDKQKRPNSIVSLYE